jgi:hypothetical protein
VTIETSTSGKNGLQPPLQRTNFVSSKKNPVARITGMGSRDKGSLKDDNDLRGKPETTD